VPKSSGLINENERQIVRRVRQVRYANQLSQSAFARALGISLDRLASIEYARTPLTVGVADKISAHFDVSLIWLAEGLGRMNPCVGLISIVSPETKASKLLSEVYSADLEQQFRKLNLFAEFSAAAILTGEAGLPKGKDAARFVEGFYHSFDDLFHLLPHNGKEKLLALAARTLSSFSLDWATGKHDTPGENITMAPKNILPDVSTSKLKVDNVAASVMVPGMSSEIPTWKQIVAALKRLTKPSGAKAQLAKELKTSRQNVNKWLSGAGAPSAELTLEVFRWVEDHGGWKQK
jgi:transcriptional regulator with XRE-family HTH domain